MGIDMNRIKQGSSQKLKIVGKPWQRLRRKGRLFLKEGKNGIK
jgi:hypothetical protein